MYLTEESCKVEMTGEVKHHIVATAVDKFLAAKDNKLFHT